MTTDTEVADTNRLTSWLAKMEIKDWLLFVPILGSFLSVVYETGCFIPLGSAAFGLFSLSDHFLWTLQALPLAVAAMAGIITAQFFTTSVERIPRIASARSNRFTNAFVRWIIIGAMVISALYLRSTIGIAAALDIILLRFGRNRGDRVSQSAILGFCLIIFLLAIGFDQTRAVLNLTVPAKFDFGGSNVKDLVLVRSGESGMLLFDRTENSFRYVKKDDVKSITWRRSKFPIQPEAFRIAPYGLGL
jgi:hypothetical protein